MLCLRMPYLVGMMALATSQSRGSTTKDPLIVPVVMLGKVFAIGFGWELLLFSVLALATKAASSAGLIPASN